jgi:biotin-(acetyl-CoA carboxylase) ligase
MGDVQLTVRPAVPMGFLVAAPAIAAMGVVDAASASGSDELGIYWPHDVVVAAEGTPVCAVSARGGYDDQGVFVRIDLTPSGGASALPAEANLEDAVRARFDQWERDVSNGRSAGGAWASFLSDYFDREPRLGKRVEVIYPNGRVAATGTFAGLDVWGRATVTLDSGRQLEFSPEQAGIRLA